MNEIVMGIGENAEACVRARVCIYIIIIIMFRKD